jgi:ribosomal protein S18 acetylase RimI-like enzyme
MIQVRPLTVADLALGLRLSRQAGWNQLEGDWQRFRWLQPDGCFVAEWDGVPAGTTTTCIFGQVAWIAMVLVDESFRRRGLGKALLERALEFLDHAGVDTVRLDATPLGQPLYERLGFREQFRLARYAGTPSPGPAVNAVEPARPEDWPALASLDAEVTGTDRRRVLDRLFAENPAAVRMVRRQDRPFGFLTARPGQRALQIGPSVAAPEVGPLLLLDAWHRHAGQPFFVDIPVPNEAGTRLAEATGLIVQRSLTRMCRGHVQCERLDWLWASSGPEKG